MEPAAPHGQEDASTSALQSVGEDPEQETRLWTEFYRLRQRQLASHDCLAALVFMAMQAVAGLQIYSGGGIGPAQALLTALVLSQALTVAMAAGSKSEEYYEKRRGLLAALRMAGSFTPIVHAHARYMMQSPHEDVHAPWGLVRALARLFYGDNCTLLAYLSMAFHIDGFLDVAVQLFSLAVVMWQNELVCSSPYLESLQSVAGLGDMHRGFMVVARTLFFPVHRTFYHLGDVEVCKLYTSALQMLCGCVAPLLFHFCSHAKQAVRYAQEKGISLDTTHSRMAAFCQSRVYHWTCLAARLLAMLPITAGVVVLMSYAPQRS